MANKITGESFKHLRVYKSLTVPLLINTIACNRLMKLNYLVDKAPNMYKVATKFFGKTLINGIVNSTYCRVFSGGKTVR